MVCAHSSMVCIPTKNKGNSLLINHISTSHTTGGKQAWCASHTKPAPTTSNTTHPTTTNTSSKVTPPVVTQAATAPTVTSPRGVNKADSNTHASTHKPDSSSSAAVTGRASYSGAASRVSNTGVPRESTTGVGRESNSNVGVAAGRESNRTVGGTDAHKGTLTTADGSDAKTQQHKAQPPSVLHGGWASALGLSGGVPGKGLHRDGVFGKTVSDWRVCCLLVVCCACM